MTTSPLAVLSRRLVVGPPSLRWLFDLFENAEYINAFLKLVREYLPDKEAEIMAEATNDKIGLFFYHFGERYFPLDDSRIQSVFEEGESTMPEFLICCPAWPQGLTFDDYMNFGSLKPGYTLLLGLVSSPYEAPEEVGCHSYVPRTSPGTHGERVPILDAVTKIVGEELVKLIPARGWTPKQLHKHLDKTRFQAAADWADAIHHDTGNWWYDCTVEDGDMIGWTREEIDGLTEDYRKYQRCEKSLAELEKWLEEDPRIHYAELLREILGPDKVPVMLVETFTKEIEDGKANRRGLRRANEEDIAALTKF